MKTKNKNGIKRGLMSLALLSFFAPSAMFSAGVADSIEKLEATTLAADSAYALTEGDSSSFVIEKYLETTDSEGNVTYTPINFDLGIKDIDLSTSDSKTTVYYKWNTSTEEKTLSSYVYEVDDYDFSVTYDNSSVASSRVIVYSTTAKGSIESNFVGKNATSGDLSGSAIYNLGEIADIKGTFLGNYATSTSTSAYGGAIFSYGGSIDSISGDFILNHIDVLGYAYGGAIANYSSTINGDITGNFIGNYAISSGYEALGGAIFNYGTISGDIEGDFIANYVKTSDLAFGGAIYSNGNIGNLTGDFVANSATSTNSKAFGGAIYLLGTSGDITGDFIANEVESSVSEANGGGIYNAGSISSISGDFIDNSATSEDGDAHGGAIYNSNSIGTITGSFVGNSALSTNANAYGGAIINYSDSSSITSIVGDFANNYASGAAYAYGGAIINYSNATTSTIFSVEGNITGNYATASTSAYGGAIYNAGNITFNATSDSYVYLNNYASTDDVVNADDDANGGFLYSVYATTTFNTDSGYSIIIGDGTAGYDSIASVDILSEIVKTGEGELIINSSMEYYKGVVYIEEGSMILNNTILGAGSTSVYGGASLYLNDTDVINTIILGDSTSTETATLYVSNADLDYTLSLEADANVAGDTELIVEGDLLSSADIAISTSGISYISLSNIDFTGSKGVVLDSSATLSGDITVTSTNTDLIAVETTDGTINLADGTSISSIVVDENGDFVSYGVALTNVDTGNGSGLSIYVYGSASVYGDIVANSPLNISGNLTVGGGTISGDSLYLADGTVLTLSTGTDGTISSFSGVSSVSGNGDLVVDITASTLAGATYTLADNEDFYSQVNGSYLTEAELEAMGLSIETENGTTVLKTSTLSYFSDAVTDPSTSELAAALDGITSTGDAAEDLVLSTFKTDMDSENLSDYIANGYSYIAELNTMLLSNMNYANVNRARAVLHKGVVVHSPQFADEDGSVSIENEDGTVSVIDIADVPNVRYENLAQLQSINLIGSKDGNNGKAGYDYWSAGSTANIDSFLSDNALFGISIGGAYNKVEGDTGDRANSTAFLMNLYGAIKTDDYPLEVFFNIGYAYFWNDLSNASSKADWDSSGFTALGGIAYEIDLGVEGLKLSPMLMMNLVTLNSDSATLTGNTFDTSIYEQDYVSAKLMLGIEAEYAISYNFNAILRLMWAHEFGDESYDMTYGIGGVLNGVNYLGSDSGRDSAVVGLGLSYDFSERCSAYFDYNAYIYESLTTHSLNLSVGFRF